MRRIPRFSVLFAALAAAAYACTVVSTPFEVGPNFQVKVEDRGRPVRGLPLEVTGTSRYTATTDGNGIARFLRIPDGNYSLGARSDSDSIFRSSLQVSAYRSDGVIVPLKWPSIPPISARSLAGILRGPDFYPSRSQPRLSLGVLEPVSGKVRAQFESNERGEFQGPAVPPGMYVLDVRSIGRIAIELSADSAADRFEIDFGFTSCGLWYSDSAASPRDTLQASRITGRIADSTGASLPNAKVNLFGPSGVLVERLTADESGDFTAASSSPGTYELVVQYQGFTPLHTNVQVVPASASTNPRMLALQLGIGGVCGGAFIR